MSTDLTLRNTISSHSCSFVDQISSENLYYSTDMACEVTADNFKRLNFNAELINYLQTEYGTNENVEETLVWLSTTPNYSTLRVNTLCNTAVNVSENIRNYFKENIGKTPEVSVHPELNDVVIILNLDDELSDLEPRSLEVIVDAACGASVLRGADVYVPAVMGMLAGVQFGDTVSVYADVLGKCKKGLKTVYSHEAKLFIGNGIVKMNRRQLYGKKFFSKGLAVQMISRVSRCPRILIPDNTVLQNIPSILTSYALNAQKNETILDMCAAPGNKTTHIAAFMNNQGLLIALDRTESKINLIRKRCEEFSILCVKCFAFDSTKAVSRESFTNENTHKWVVHNGPPFQQETFDRILLDAPCSPLGQRPQLLNKISLNQLHSYPKLQKKLFEAAYELLKPGGCLVYSTCTVTVAENESVVSWALKKYADLVLTPFTPKLAECGLPFTDLSPENCKHVQRFGLPCDSNDTVGFFIAKFEKK